MRFRWKVGAVLAVALTLGLASCSSTPSSKSAKTSTSAAGPGKSGGVVKFAGLVGEGPSYFFPMYTGSFWDTGYIPWASYLMYPPLYVWGENGKTVFNPKLSLAYPPAFSKNAAGQSVVKITMKPRKWSDGKPITTRDVEFWMNLLKVEKINWAPYVPHTFPDNVSKIDYMSPTTMTITFKHYYDPEWLLGNELSQITPMPQHAWDKTSASSPVGNYDMTPSGAKAVYNFLQGQAKHVSTFPTNPLWKVVSGPWEIKSYTPADQYMSMVPNPRYPWPQKEKISQFVTVPFTSDSSELNALESGLLTVGYVPLSDLAVLPRLKAEGYKIVDWNQDTMGGLLLQYAKDDKNTPILKQLYVRQALTHLIDMQAILHTFYHGHGFYDSGPIPNPSGNAPYVSQAEKSDPYPFNIGAAKGLLKAHGWHVVPNGLTTCQRPGTGAGDCGAGIAKGQAMSFTMVSTKEPFPYNLLTPTIKSEFAAAGVQVSVKSEPYSQLTVSLSECLNKSHCSWDMIPWLGYWPFGWTDWYPTGDPMFACGAGGNGSNICNPELQRLIVKSYTAPPSQEGKDLQAYENYMVHQQLDIYLPIPVFRLVAVKSKLQGVAPLDPYLLLHPENWYYTK